jgi:pimeloyl-ACP methyl ester carboxylesterase
MSEKDPPQQLDATQEMPMVDLYSYNPAHPNQIDPSMIIIDAQVASTITRRGSVVRIPGVGNAQVKSKASTIVPPIPLPMSSSGSLETMSSYPSDGETHEVDIVDVLTSVPLKLYLKEEDFNTLKRRHGHRVGVTAKQFANGPHALGMNTLLRSTDSSEALLTGIVPKNIFDSSARGFWYDHRDVANNTFAQEAIIKHSIELSQSLGRGLTLEEANLVPELNYDVSFRHMLWRRLQRTKYGAYRPSKRSKIVWFLLIFVLFLILSFSVLFRIWGADLGEVLYKNLSSLIVFVILIPIAGSAFVNASGFFSRMMLFWILLGAVIFFIIDLIVVVPNGDAWFEGEQSRAIAISLTLLILLLELVTFIGYMLYFYIYPRLLLTGVFGGRNAQSLFRIKPDPDPNHLWLYTYFSLDDDMAYTCCRKHPAKTFQYAGELDQDMRPHGFGEWRDDSALGETLSGFWDHGIPRAPFISRELGTLNMFASLRLLYARNNAAEWKNSSSRPSRDGEELMWGVAEVECSVAGVFNRYLPKASLLVEPTSQREVPTIVADCLKEIAFGAALELGTEEVVICTHGFYASLEWAIKNYGQMAALGNLASRCRIVCFDWPGGNPLSFNQARKMSTDDGVRRDLAKLVDELTKEGVKRFSFVGHSMGCRVTLLLAEVMHQLFQPLPNSGLLPTKEDLPTISSITLINAEMEQDTWLNAKYPIVRRYCNVITLFCDDNDMALFVAQMWMGNGRQVVGMNPRGQYLLQSDIPGAGDTLSRPNKRKDVSDLKSRSQKRYLDVDVIDATALDSNVHPLRHGYFVLNRLIIDDIADIILLKKRAKERTGLLRREGNSFVFLVAPTYLQN